MRRLRKALLASGATLLASLWVSGCLGGAVFDLADEPLEGLPPYGEVDPEEAAAVILALQGHAGFVLIDIRTPAEVETGHVPGAVNIDFRNAGFESEIDILDRDLIYLIYCRTANRTGQAFARMTEMGFSRVYDMRGGITLWDQLGYPVCEGPIGEEHTCIGQYPTEPSGG